MEEFIQNKNIERFRQLLATSTDEAERRILTELLAQEEAEHAASKNGRRLLRALLAVTTDEAERKILSDLLAREEAERSAPEEGDGDY